MVHLQKYHQVSQEMNYMIKMEINCKVYTEKMDLNLTAKNYMIKMEMNQMVHIVKQTQKNHLWKYMIKMEIN